MADVPSRITFEFTSRMPAVTSSHVHRRHARCQFKLQFTSPMPAPPDALHMCTARCSASPPHRHACTHLRDAAHLRNAVPDTCARTCAMLCSSVCCFSTALRRYRCFSSSLCSSTARIRRCISRASSSNAHICQSVRMMQQPRASVAGVWCRVGSWGVGGQLGASGWGSVRCKRKLRRCNISI